MSGAAAELRARLAEGSVYGTFVKLPALESIEIVAASGFHFAVVDREHSQLGESEARQLVRHAVALGFPTLVRVPDVDGGVINRILEAGAAGIQLSALRHRDQVDDLIAATRYPPAGRRSLSLSHPAAHYGADGLIGYLEASEDGPLLVGQVETATTDTPINELTQDLDVVFIGTADLSVDLGAPGDTDSMVVRQRIKHIATGRAERVHLGGWIGSADQADVLAQYDARYVMIGSDLQLLQTAVKGVGARFSNG